MAIEMVSFHIFHMVLFTVLRLLTWRRPSVNATIAMIQPRIQIPITLKWVQHSTNNMDIVDFH